MDQLEEIKSKIEIVSFISQYVVLKKAGRNFKAVCPFHADKTPSFIVSPERQIFKCFGCGEGGDIFKFLMRYENLDFPEALKILAEKAGVALRGDSEKHAASEKDVYFRLNELAADFYHYLLMKDKNGEKARKYLEKRKINKNSAEKFRLGYAPASWEISGRFFEKKGYKREILEKAGFIVRKNQGRGYYDKFRGRLMFPIRDLRGNVAGFSGRLIHEDKEAPKYMNTPETLVYQKGKLLYGLYEAREAIRKEEAIILCEGNIDIISAHQAGYENIAAPLGTAFTEEQAKLIKRFTENVYLSFDADIAGDKAMHRGITLLEKEDLNIKVLDLKEGKDIDEVLQKNPLGLKKAMREAVPIYDFFINSSLRRFNPKDPFQKKEIGKELLPILGRMENAVLRGHYLQKLAEILELEDEVIFKEAERLYKNENFYRKKSVNLPGIGAKEHRMLRLSKYVLSLIFQEEELDLDLIQDLELEYLEDKLLNSIWRKFRNYLDSEKEFLISDFCVKLEPSELELMNELLLYDLSFLKDEERQEEIKKGIQELKKSHIKKTLKEWHEDLIVAEKNEEEKEIEEISQKMSELTKEL